MRRILLIFILFPSLLFAQEKVSNIEAATTNSITNISRKIGFTMIDGEQYMLHEKDSLLIFKQQGAEYELLHTIPDYKCLPLNFSLMDPNRSLFEIREDKYYRLFSNSLQIIEIPTGEIIYEFDGEQENIDFITPIELVDNRFYFQSRTGSERKNWVLNLSNNSLRSISDNLRNQNYQLGDIRISVTGIDSVYIENLITGSDSLIFTSNSQIVQILPSRTDSTFIVVNEDGDIWRLSNYNYELFNCQVPLPVVSSNLMYNRNGDRLIISYKQGLNSQKVFILNLVNCDVEMELITPEIESYIYGPVKIRSETNDTDYTILSYLGEDPTDGPSKGFFIFLDHLSGQFAVFEDVYSVQHHTPFKYDNEVYFVAYQQSFWTQELEFFVKYDFDTGELTELRPENEGYLKYATLGYPIDGEISCATNMTDEDVSIWSLDAQENFNLISKPNFQVNVGVGVVQEINTDYDRIYFTGYGGLYSLLDEAKNELFLSDGELTLDSPWIMTNYGNKLCLVRSNEERHPVFHILDTQTNELTEHIDSSVTTSISTVISAGPYLLYSNGNSDDTLKFFDIRTEQIFDFNEIPYTLTSWTAAGDKRAVFWYKPINQTQITYVYQIDYATNDITKIEIDLKRHKDLKAGPDNVFYFMDSDDLADSTRVRRLDAEHNLVTIYNDTGWYLSRNGKFYAHEPGSEYSHIGLLLTDDNSIAGDSSLIITDNGQNTSFEKIQYHHTSGTFSPIIGLHDSNLLLESRTDGTFNSKILFYNPAQGIDEITPINGYLKHFEQLEDEVILFVKNYNSGELTLVSYGNAIGQTTTTIINKNCSDFNSDRGMRIDETKILLSGSCEEGVEPWIYDQTLDSLYLLADLFPGSGSSIPANFVRFKDWIYFTANLKSVGRQWFRLKYTEETSILESARISQYMHIFPNPSYGEIRLSKNYELLVIFSIEGKEVKRINNLSSTTSIKLENLVSGTYILLGLTTEGVLETGKVVKV